MPPQVFLPTPPGGGAASEKGHMGTKKAQGLG
jgi:hypothetical protein